MLTYEITKNIDAQELAYTYWELKLKDLQDDEYVKALMDGIDHFKEQKKQLIKKELYEQVIVVDEVIRIFAYELYEI